jgi:hypothetical protein
MEEFIYRVRSKSGFSPKQRNKIAQVLYAMGAGGDEFPGDDLLDSNGVNLQDSSGNDLEAVNY